MAEQKRKFTSIWVNQTRLGMRFGMSAIAVGRRLKELGLKGDDNAPTQRALDEGYARSTPMRDGTPFYMWNSDKVTDLLRDAGLQTINRREQEARDFAHQLVVLERQARERPGAEKEAKLLWDVIPEHLVERVKRLLDEVS